MDLPGNCLCVLALLSPILIVDACLQVQYIDIIQTHDIEFGDIEQV